MDPHFAQVSKLYIYIFFILTVIPSLYVAENKCYKRISI